MSLWLESLSLCLYDSENETELKAKCILSHLSMDIPRSWWEKALETNNIQDSHASILQDLLKDLLRIPRLAGKINSGLLIALAFADKRKMKPKVILNLNLIKKSTISNRYKANIKDKNGILFVIK